MRNMVSHPSRQQFLSAEGLSTLQRYGDWLQSRIRFLESGIESAEVPVADV
jgi:hypothetical protein